MERDYQGVITAALFCLGALLVCFAGGYAIGKSQGTHTVETIWRAPEVRQGELPEGVPVMLYWLQPDGTIAGESAIRTTYQGALPFSVKAHAVPFRRLTDWDYWVELHPAMMGGTP